MKIKCPHCGATNQDVSENDPCWQCGTVLSAPPSALDTGEGAPTSTANPVNPPPDTSQASAPPTTTPASPAARASEPPPVQPSVPQTIQRPAPATDTRPAKATNWVAVSIIIALIVIVIIIAVIALRPH